MALQFILNGSRDPLDEALLKSGCDFDLSDVGLAMKDGLLHMRPESDAHNVAALARNFSSTGTHVFRDSVSKLILQNVYTIIFSKHEKNIQVAVYPQGSEISKFCAVRDEFNLLGPSFRLSGSVGSIEAQEQDENASERPGIHIRAIQSHFKQGETFSNDDVQRWINWRFEGLSAILDHARANGCNVVFDLNDPFLSRQLYRKDAPTLFLTRIMKLGEYFGMTSGLENNLFVISHKT